MRKPLVLLGAVSAGDGEHPERSQSQQCSELQTLPHTQLWQKGLLQEKTGKWLSLLFPSTRCLPYRNPPTHTCKHANRPTTCLNTSKESSPTHPTHPWTIPVFFSSSGCLDSHINTVLSEWLITMYYSSKCTAAVWLMLHRKWSRSGVFVVRERVGGRHVRMWSGSVCGTVDVVAGEKMCGACLMAVVLVRVCRCGGAVGEVKKQTDCHWFSFSCPWCSGPGPPIACWRKNSLFVGDMCWPEGKVADGWEEWWRDLTEMVCVY